MTTPRYMDESIPPGYGMPELPCPACWPHDDSDCACHLCQGTGRIRVPDDYPVISTDNGNVRLLLDLSTSHLPGQRALDALTSYDGVVAYKTTYGALMWVPEDVDGHNADYEDVPDFIQTIQRHARSLDCDYVLFDQDGPTEQGLLTWEW